MNHPFGSLGERDSRLLGRPLFSGAFFFRAGVYMRSASRNSMPSRPSAALKATLRRKPFFLTGASTTLPFFLPGRAARSSCSASSASDLPFSSWKAGAAAPLFPRLERLGLGQRGVVHRPGGPPNAGFEVRPARFGPFGSRRLRRFRDRSFFGHGRGRRGRRRRSWRRGRRRGRG